MMKSEHFGFVALLLLSMVVASGCGDSTVAEGFKKANKINMQKISNAYRMYASVNGNVGPKDEQEFKDFLRSDERVAPRLGLSKADLEDLDQYFISGADGEPFVILYGQQIKPDLDWSAIAFDKTGVDGMRRIALACSEIIEVTDEQKYQRILAGKIEKKDVPAHVFGGPIDEAVEDEVVIE